MGHGQSPGNRGRAKHPKSSAAESITCPNAASGIVLCLKHSFRPQNEYISKNGNVAKVNGMTNCASFPFSIQFSLCNMPVSSNWPPSSVQTSRSHQLQGKPVVTRKNDSSLTFDLLQKFLTCILLKNSLSHRLSFLMIPFRTSAFFRLAANSRIQRFREVSAWLKIWAVGGRKHHRLSAIISCLYSYSYTALLVPAGYRDIRNMVK